MSTKNNDAVTATEKLVCKPEHGDAHALRALREIFQSDGTNGSAYKEMLVNRLELGLGGACNSKSSVKCDLATIEERREMLAANHIPQEIIERFSNFMVLLTHHELLELKKDHQPALRRNFHRKPEDQEGVETREREIAGIRETFMDLGKNVIDQQLYVSEEIGGAMVRRPLEIDELKSPDLYIEEKCLMSFPKERTQRRMAKLAAENRFHPMGADLKKCGQEFTGTLEEAEEIISSVAKVYMNNDTELANYIFKLLLVNIVGLAFLDNTIQCPNYLVVLCGEQGCYKSSFWEILFTLGLTRNADFYSVVSSPPENFFKDCTLTSVTPGMEFAEIERFTSPQKNLNALKSAITDKKPLGRRPYDPVPVRQKRYAVWVGSTNHPTAVLTDRSSTYDRRLIPIQIKSGEFIDTVKWREDVAKVMGAAVKVYEAGLIPEPHSLPSSLFSNLSEYQEDFKEITPFEETLVAYARGMNIVEVNEALACCFGYAAADITKEMIADARLALKPVIAELGFKQFRMYINNRTSKVAAYRRADPLTDQELVKLRQDINLERTNKISFPVIKMREQEHDF